MAFRILLAALLAASASAGAASTSVAAQTRLDRRGLTRVTDNVYSAVGYALGNEIYVITRTGVVVIE